MCRCATLTLLTLILIITPLAEAQKGPAISLEAFPSAEAAQPGEHLDIALAITVPEGWHVNARKPLDEFLIPTEIQLDPFPAAAQIQAVYPAPKQIKSAFSEDPLAVYGGQFTIALRITWAANATPGEQTLQGAFNYQACNDTQCIAPASKPFTITTRIINPGETITPLNPAQLNGITWENAETIAGETTAPATETPATPEPAATSPATDWQTLAQNFAITRTTSGYQNASTFLTFLKGDPSASSTGMFANRSSAWVLLLVILGGLALNLTPCVLPLIPITIGIIGAGARAGSRRKGFGLGALYGLGIALVYGALGLIVVLGLSNTFGAINASPVFNIAIALLFIVLALAMFDLILIDFSRFQARFGIKKASSGSWLLALFMGAISALLAGACVAPVVLSTILYAQDRYAQGQTFALALPFALGLGMALPWPFAGAGLSFLPKPGAWMVRIKQVFGLFIIIMAAYYAYLAYTLTFSAPATTTASTDLAAGLARAQAENKPVLIDFWATWCKNCTMMDKTTLKDETIQNALSELIFIKYQAERFDDPATQALLEHFHVLGLPTYVILTPNPENPAQ